MKSATRKTLSVPTWAISTPADTRSWQPQLFMHLLVASLHAVPPRLHSSNNGFESSQDTTRNRTTNMTSVTQNWTPGPRLSVGWAKIMKNQKAALIYNYIAWNTSYKRWYENLRFLNTLRDGAKVLDVPCGGGPVLPN